MTTENISSATSNQSTFSIGFTVPTDTSEIQVYVEDASTGAMTLQTAGTHYNIVGTDVVFTSGNEPAAGTDNVQILRNTDVSSTTKHRTFVAGSSIRAADLNANFTRLFDHGEDKIQTNDIANKAVTNSKIAKLAIGTNKIADLAVTTAKIANNSVTSDKIADNAVIPAKIADNAVTPAKLSETYLTQSEITNLVSVTTASGQNFTQQGTGAVARTVDNKLTDVLSVKDFGVTGDGSTDDGANIQIAIDAAANKKLYFPSGTYKITDRQININNSIYIIGDGKNTVFQSTIADGSSVTQCFKISSSNVTLEDISIDSRNGDADSGDVTILIKSSTTAGFINDTLFKNVHITGGNTLQTSGTKVGFPCNHGVLINDNTNVRRLRIDSCHWEKLHIGFFTTNTYGDPTDGDISSQDITIINSSFTDFGARPFIFNSSFVESGKTFAFDGVKVIGCHFARLIGTDPEQRSTYLGGDGVRNLTVTGCEFRDLIEPNDGVIHVENHCDNFICTNNTFFNCAGGITYYSLSTKAIITNNIILSNIRRRQKVKVTTAKVSTANNTIEIEGHEYETGDPIVYDKGGHPNNTVITGLSSGTTYNVIKVDEKLLKLATSYNNALAGTAINLTGTGNNRQTFGSEPSYFPEEATVGTSAVSTTNNTITISNHGYHTKDSILYENGGGTSITGLTSGQVYYVVKIDANTFKLATTLSNAAASSPTTLGLTGTGNNAQKFSPYSLETGSNGIKLIFNSDGSVDRTIVSNNLIEGFHKGISFSGNDTTHEISDNLINLCTYGLNVTSGSRAFIATRNRVNNSKYFADIKTNASVTLTNNICDECTNVFTSTITGSRNNVVKNFKIIKTITDYVGGQTPGGSPTSFRTLMQAPTFGKGQFDARVFETEAASDESVAVADYKFAAADGTLTLSNYERVNKGSSSLNATGSNSFRINSNNFEVSAYNAATQYLTWEISFTGNLVFTDNSTVSGTTTTVDTTTLINTENIALPDNKKLQLGDSQDLFLLHDGTDSFIENTNGNLLIRPKAGENGLKLFPDGSVYLYYNNAIKTTTASWGLSIWGICQGNSLEASTGYIHVKNDNQPLKIGQGSDLSLLHNGTDSKITNITGNLLIESKASQTAIKVIPDGNVELSHSGTTKLNTSSSGITVTGSVTTQDMNMSNLNGTANEVDSTKGSWSIQEGADDLFLINRVSGKKYKFNITEVS